MLTEVVTCGECIHFERYSKNGKYGECTNESVVTDLEQGAEYRCDRFDDDYCSYGEKGDLKVYIQGR